MVTRIIVKLVLAVFLLNSSAFGAQKQWTSWRGPDYDGSSDVTGLPSRWSDTENVRWKTELPGLGASTPVISGDKIFLTAEVDEDRKLLAICLDRVTGKILWKKQFGNGVKLMRNNMAASSAVVDENNAYFIFGNCVLTCTDHDGNKKWARNLEKDYGKSDIKFGFSSTPLLYQGRLYIVVMSGDVKNTNAKDNGTQAMGHYLLAIDPASGKTLWKHTRPIVANTESQQAYTSPILLKGKAGAQILLLGGDCMTSHDPETGAEIWRWSGYNEKDSNRHRVITSPATAGDVAIVCEPRHLAVFALRTDGKGEIEKNDILWKYEGGTDATTPLFYEGILYVVDGDRKMLMAVDADSGKELWSSKLPSKKVYRASPVAADGKVYCFGSDGQVTVFKAGRKRKELATMEMGGDGCRATIAISDGCLFVRTTEALHCISK